MSGTERAAKPLPWATILGTTRQASGVCRVGARICCAKISAVQPRFLYGCTYSASQQYPHHLKRDDISFGFSATDLATVVRLAWSTVQNARKACGEYDELTCEVDSLHTVLERLKHEAERRNGPLSRRECVYATELNLIVQNCGKTLRTLDGILAKYNALTDGERSTRKLWKQIRFGNGAVQSLVDIRIQLGTHTSLISMMLNMISIGTTRAIGLQVGVLTASL